ncbi:hypothetical protein ACH40F_07850 [Streptomyces sp. NPDC020794]|uniref:hypothetical protein n=1 Tax=unclassified Streptomyces TaxID=2593676 RepID=UPI0036ED5D9E
MSMLRPDAADLAAELRRLHYEHEHQCCWIFDSETQCGLWCGHDGEHLPHVGEYLPPPIVSPVWVLQFRQQMMARAWVFMRCPLCGARPPAVRPPASRLLWERGFEVECTPMLACREWEGYEQITQEMQWRFEPCGCEGREMLPGEAI